MMTAAWEGSVRKCLPLVPQLSDLSFSSMNIGKDTEQRLAQFRVASRYWLIVGIHLRELDSMLLADVADHLWMLARIKREYQKALKGFSEMPADLHPPPAPVNPRVITNSPAKKLAGPYELAAEAKACSVCGKPMRVAESVQAQEENGRTVHYRVLTWECDVALHQPVVHAEKLA